MFRGRRNTAATRDAQTEKFSIWESSRGGGWGSNSLSFSHAESRNSHFTGGLARRFFAAIAATALVFGMVASVGVTAASAATPLSVTTTSPLPLAPLNTPYATTLAATGGTGSYTWSVASGSTLPSWLSLNSSTGVLSGTPTTNSTATFAVTVTDSASPADTATSGQLTLYVGNGGEQPFSLNLTSGSWRVLATGTGPSQTFPPQTTTVLVGQVDPLTGAITDATLSLPAQYGVCSAAAGGCTNYFMDEVNPGTATGSINSNGDITLNDSLSYELDVTTPVTSKCLSTPINMTFQSTAPYDTSTGDVTLSASNYNIPAFTGLPGTVTPVDPAGSCGLAEESLNIGGYPYQVAGSTSNNTTLNLQGTGLPIPPPPGKPSTNVLSASPASPQLTTTSVTLTDTISSGGAVATAATGTVNFMANGNVIGTVPVSNGGATYTTTALPSQTNQLTAVYSGDFNYSTSTSPAVSYAIQPLPSVTLNLPTTVELSSPTPTPFSVTITNPSTSQSWSSNYLQIQFQNPNGFETGDGTVAYQDSAGDWCQMPTIFPSSQQMYAYFSGFATSCGTPPSSFSLAPGQSLTINLQLSLTYDTSEYGPGPATARATLYNGGCTVPVTDQGSCTPSNSPFNSIAPTQSGAPEATGTFTMTYGARVPVSFSNNDIPTTPVPEGYLILAYGDLRPASNPYYIMPEPTGALTYLVDGTVVGTSGNNSFFHLMTAGLSPGTHTLTIEYSGDPVYSPSSYSQAFTVAPPAPGTSFVCQTNDSNYPTLNASVVAVATVPNPVPSGSTVPVSALDLTLNIDAIAGPVTYGPVSNATIGLSPGGGTIAPPSVTPTIANGIESVSWTGLSSTVPISGTPGTVVPVAISSLSFKGGGVGGTSYACNPTDMMAPAVVQQVTVSGTVLTMSLSGSAAVGIPVTLTATVYPTPSDYASDVIVGQVDFFDGTTDLGTVGVPSIDGIATLTTTSLAPGDHTLTAVWSGGPTPAQTSDPVDFQVGTAPSVTTQPTNQTASAGAVATFTAAATGDPIPTVQWQVSTDGGKTFTDIAGATSNSYTTPASDNGNEYQAVFSNAAGPDATTNPATLMVIAPSTTGYRMVASNGAVSTFGNAGNYGSEAGQPLNAPIVGMAATPDNKGYWLVGADGGVFTFGDAGYYGSEGGQHLNAPIVGMAATPDGKGYWLVAADGGIFTFGDATFYGSEGGQHLNQPVVGMAATPDGKGYWLVASDGGIFTFGDATFLGSEGGQHLNAPVVGMAATPSGNGYWLVAKDGGVFTFGDASFQGSAAGQSNAPVIGLTPTPGGGGYWIGAQDGGIFTFGNAPFNGSAVGTTTAPIVGIAP